MKVINLVAQLETMKRRFSERVQDTFIADLGNGNGQVFKALGYVWVRAILGVDDYGKKIYTPPFFVRSGSDPNYLTMEGVTVRVGLDEDGELAVIKSDWSANIAKGQDPQAGNPRDSRSYFLMKRQWTELVAQAVTTASQLSTQVGVGAFLYIDNYGKWKAFSGSRIDLSTYIPATDYHRLALVYLKTKSNTLGVSTSTSQLMTSSLDSTDIQEALDAMDAESIPIMLYKLEDGQTSITDASEYEDVRGMVNVPHVYGFPKTITRPTRVGDNQQVTVFGQITLNSQLTNDGEIVLI
jgi:hypothetical protein